jgi:hypothetical protein
MLARNVHDDIVGGVAELLPIGLGAELLRVALRIEAACALRCDVRRLVDLVALRRERRSASIWRR